MDLTFGSRCLFHLCRNEGLDHFLDFAFTTYNVSSHRIYRTELLHPVYNGGVTRSPFEPMGIGYAMGRVFLALLLSRRLLEEHVLHYASFAFALA